MAEGRSKRRREKVWEENFVDEGRKKEGRAGRFIFFYFILKHTSTYSPDFFHNINNGQGIQLWNKKNIHEMNGFFPNNFGI